MSDFRNPDGDTRRPTWLERDQLRAVREDGVEDVLHAPDATPETFWDIIIQATPNLLMETRHEKWTTWRQNLDWMLGFSPRGHNWDIYESLVRNGLVIRPSDGSVVRYGLAGQVSAIELLMDVAFDADEFAEAVNERARWFRVGLRIERGRFVPVTEEHAHTELVQPALQLLGERRFETVDTLYRKAFERVMSGDPAGAITNASSVIEEMLRIGLGTSGGDLGQLVGKARNAGWLAPSVAAITTKFAAFRDDSDAHTTGTSDFDTAMFAIHLASTILLFLSKTEPYR